jgi:hypothetical protein
MKEKPAKYSDENWAHKALLLMDEADWLLRFASVTCSDTDRYKASATAFWDVCGMLAKERSRLHSIDPK